MRIRIDKSWMPYLGDTLGEPPLQELLDWLESERRQGKTIYPAPENTFESLCLTTFQNVKVVILGQDPYHGAGQAHGLAFSVQKGVKPPPSLVNIFKELKADLGIDASHGNLEHWARQGVLLLNTVLTVEQGCAGSHHKKGWERFSDKVIDVLSSKKEHLVFILWGAPAQKVAVKIDTKKHLVLTSVHPSPLSVYRGFFGSRPFSQTNAYLRANGIKEIDWSV